MRTSYLAIGFVTLKIMVVTLLYVQFAKVTYANVKPVSESLRRRVAPMPTRRPITPSPLEDVPTPPYIPTSNWGLQNDINPTFHPDIEAMWNRTMSGPTAGTSCALRFPVVTMYGGFIEDLFTALETNKSFSWVRLGDGEVGCLADRRERVVAQAHCNLDSKHAFKETIKALPSLRNVFTAIGTWWLCHGSEPGKIHDKLVQWLRVNTKIIGGPPFAFLDGFYLPFGGGDGPEHAGVVRSCRGRDIVIIGPKVLERLQTSNMFNIKGHVVTAGAGRLQDVMPAIDEARSIAANHTDVVFLVAFGVHAKVLIVKASQLMPGHTFIDVGSSLDAYVGVRSRDYNKNLERYCKDWPSWMAGGVCAQVARDKEKKKARLAR